MRIAFCGKGGSGKTTLASLFVKYLAARKADVLAIDGDINQHLGIALGWRGDEIAALPKLGQRQEILKDYVRGANPRIRQASDIIESTPAGRGSAFISRAGDDPVTKTFITARNGIRFMGVGGHEDHDVGTTCFHKFTGAEGIFLNHYLDAADEYVIGDMCAGADPFASSGLATRYDACVLVMEPTMKSLAVYHQAQEYVKPYNVRILPVANKIMGADDRAFIEQQIGATCITAFAPLDAVRDAEKGIAFIIDDLDDATKGALTALKAAIDNLPARDWAHYRQVGLAFHKRAADGWASAMYGTDMMAQDDPDFIYPDVAALAKAA